ncbi:MAG: glycoside hydrolase domain-containing protein [Planctomycetota bacterium]
MKRAAGVLAAAGAAFISVVMMNGFAAQNQPLAVADEGQTALGIEGGWRLWGVSGPGMIPLDLLKAAKPDANAPVILGDRVETSPPPPDWMKPDFDDAAWPRTAGPFPCGWRGHADIWGLEGRTLLCLRGKFSVQDPAAIKKLVLSMKYAGGVVVYLNGSEALRQDMPAGELKPGTPALPYPLEAYVDSQGKIIPILYAVGRRVQAGEKDLADRVARREAREVKPAEIPVKGLRKGVNVLAVEVHIAAHRPEAREFLGKSESPQWPHIGLTALQLATDAAPGAVESNLARRKGFSVWNQDMHRQFNDADCGDPHESLQPIRLIGARNGCYSGLVMVGSDASIDGLTASVTDLKGTGTIAAVNIRVRYAQLSRLCQGYNAPSTFIGLEEEPPAKVAPGGNKSAVQPVWVTVRTPKDASAGKYQGTLEISASGVAAVKVPVELEVADWTLPDPTAFRNFMAIYESPDSVALQYDVPMWSEEHWKRLEKSAQLMGYVGNNLAVMHLICHTEFGNDESMVTWIKKADGSYDYDFTVFDRYLDLMTKYCTIKVVACQVYFGGDWGRVDPTKKAVSVTVLDPATQKREMLTLPFYGTEESKKQWKPLLDQIRERLKKRGLEEGLVFGLGHCGGIHKDTIAFFNELAPGHGWHIAKHNRARPGEFPQHRYVEWMYVPGDLPVPSTLPRFPNDGKGLISIMMQRITDAGQPPISLRTMAERAYLLGDSGAGRICLDFWPVKGGIEGYGTKSLYDRWPAAMACQRQPHFKHLSAPGKLSAVSTPKIEALREGLQETEARFFVEEALAAKKVGGELAEKCRKILDARVTLCKLTHMTSDQLVAIENWLKNSEDTYRLVAEVAKAVGEN